MSKKRIILLISFIFCISTLISQETIYDLCNIIIENNSDIKQAENNYKNAILSKNGANGYFSPSISISSTARVSDGYTFDKSPEIFSSIITYNQPIINGTSIGISGSYSYSITEIQKERFIAQNPQLSLKLTQSLFPFWIQGTFKDPYNIALIKETEYYYNQLLYTKTSILQDFIQNYIYAQIEYKKIQMLNNSIDLTTKQIKGLIELKKSGRINFSSISELENLKWSYQQDLLSAELNLKSYIKKIKYIAEEDFSETDFFEQYTFSLEDEKMVSFIKKITNCDYDAYEKSLLAKIEIEQITLIKLKQEAAPVAEISIQPSWNLEQQKVTRWKDSWKTSNKPANWNIGISINLSPLLNMSFGKNIDKKKLKLESEQDTYNSYLKQRYFIKRQYMDYITDYENNYKTINNLINDAKIQLNDIKIELERGHITQMDYEKMDVQVKNMILTSECLELYIFLFKVLDGLLNFLD